MQIDLNEDRHLYFCLQRTITKETLKATFRIWHGVDSIKHDKGIQVVNECFL